MSAGVLDAADQFDVLNDCVYLDTAGVGPVPRRSLDCMNQFSEWYARTGIRQPWSVMERVIAQARQAFATLVNAEADDCALIPSCSDGVNAIANALSWGPADNVVTTDVEYPANYFPWLNLEARGVEVRRVATQAGAFSITDLAAHVDERTRVIAVSHVSYLTGFRCDLTALGTLGQQSGAVTVVDGTQALGAVTTDLTATGIDAYVVSGLKWLLSPIGTGAMYVRRAAQERMRPASVSWMSMQDYQSKGPRLPALADNARKFMTTGNVDLSAYAGFTSSLAMLHEISAQRLEDRVLTLSGRLVEGITAAGHSVHTSSLRTERAGIVTFAHPDAPRLLGRLAEAGVHAVARYDGVRLSPHFFISDEALERVLETIHAC